MWKDWACGLVPLLMAEGPWASHLSLPREPGLHPLQAGSTRSGLFSLCLWPLVSFQSIHPSLMLTLVTDHSSPSVKVPTASWHSESQGAKSPPRLPDCLPRFASCSAPAPRPLASCVASGKARPALRVSVSSPVKWTPGESQPFCLSRA